MLAALSKGVVGAPFLAWEGAHYDDKQAVKQTLRALSNQAAKELPEEFETKLVGTVTIPEIVRLDQEAYCAIGHETFCAEGTSKAAGKVFGRGLNTMVLFSGELESMSPFAEYGLPTNGSADPAELLLDLYLEGFADAKGNHVDQPARLLGQLKGDFAFMLYDASVQYLLVCRNGVNSKLYWGLNDTDTSMLLIASVKANLTEFPAGCAFESKLENGVVTNKMINIKRENPAKRAISAMAKVDSKNHLCGLIYKSQSGTDLVSYGLGQGGIH